MHQGLFFGAKLKMDKKIDEIDQKCIQNKWRLGLQKI